MVGEHLLEFSEGIFLFFLISFHHVTFLKILFILPALIISLSVVHVGISHTVFVFDVVVSVEGIYVFNFIASDGSLISLALSVICLSIGWVRWVIESIRIFTSTFSLSCVCFRNILILFIFLLSAL